MRKIDDLRALLLTKLPELGNDDTRLRIWIDRGTGQSTQSGSASFAFKFRLNLLAIETKTDIALIAFHLFRWMRANQPDLLQPGADGFAFDADILDSSGLADILIQLDLTQNVTATPRPDGQFDLNYVEQSDRVQDDFASAAGDGIPPDILAILLGDGEQVLPDDPTA